MENDVPFEIEGLEVVPLPVLHGGDYICLGFCFGGGKFIYLSDVSEVQPHIMRQLEAYEIEILVLDCLDRDTSPSHFCYPQSLQLARHLRPKRTLLVGMSCDLVSKHTHTHTQRERERERERERGGEGTRVEDK